MHEVKYAYAKNEQNVYVFINDISQNNRYEFYYLLSDKGEKIQMIPVINGDRQKHFRTKSEGIAVGMSAEHLNLIAKLCNEKQFYCKDLDFSVTAKRAEDEYKLDDINRIVDVAYFDDNNDFLCGIEVVHTNDISDEKFIDIYNSNYLIFKVYTDAPERFIYVNNGKIDTDVSQKTSERTQYEREESNRKINKTLSKYIKQWNFEMEENNKFLSESNNELRLQCESLRKVDNDKNSRIKNEYYELEQIERELKNEVYSMQHGFYQSANYFDSLEQIRFRLKETPGEEGELIRDIEEITKQINEFYTTT